MKYEFLDSLNVTFRFSNFMSEEERHVCEDLGIVNASCMFHAVALGFVFVAVARYPSNAVCKLGSVNVLLPEDGVDQVNHSFAVGLDPCGSARTLKDVEDCPKLSSVRK